MKMDLFLPINYKRIVVHVNVMTSASVGEPATAHAESGRVRNGERRVAVVENAHRRVGVRVSVVGRDKACSPALHKRLRDAPARKTPLFLHVSYVCPEPVWANDGVCFYQKMAPKTERS